MDPDEQVCLCFRVSLRKIRTYLKVNEPKVPSALCECLDAGTGCGWCVCRAGGRLRRVRWPSRSLEIQTGADTGGPGRRRLVDGVS